MKKPSIVIASILKPIDDTRMFQKMGMSLAATGQWAVHIMGFHSDSPSTASDIQFHSLGNFPRISFARVKAPFKVFRKLRTIKPKIILICTHELLITAVVYKILFGAKLIYDVRENYFLNILNTDAFPMVVRHLIALEVRFREWLTSPFINQYILAEKSYQAELPFLSNKFTIIENKCKLPDGFKRSSIQKGIKLLFSGTIDESTGVFEAIALAKQLSQLNPEVTLTIIGYSALPSARKKILQSVDGHPFISVIGLSHLVPHERIFEEISTATAGIVFYPKSRHNENCIPTKLYEYMACRLPIIYDESAFWKTMVAESYAGIAINFKNPNHAQILKDLSSWEFYTGKIENMTWESEEGKFLGMVSCWDVKVLRW